MSQEFNKLKTKISKRVRVKKKIKNLVLKTKVLILKFKMMTINPTQKFLREPRNHNLYL
jgi:hypothetical protein